jgi:PPK2 family polyphosphate:nucleotide phosphotransferase
MSEYLFEPPASPYLVPYDGGFRVNDAASSPPKGAPKKKDCRKQLAAVQEELRGLQRMLYAQDRYSVLLVFQAMDAAGKDGTIRAVMTGLNPAGCQVFSFKQPSSEELDHDFLWRTYKSLPERGRIGIFNRSHYEEALVIRVHPEYLKSQRIPREVPLKQLWEERFDSFRDIEKHLARNGTVILKFWLNVSKEEQLERFLARIDEPESAWKYSASDAAERAHWDKYMEAYESALNATSRPWAPWYAIPANNKPFMRLKVAEVLRDTLKGLNLAYPEVSPKARERMLAEREELIASGSK